MGNSQKAADFWSLASPSGGPGARKKAGCVWELRNDVALHILEQPFNGQTRRHRPKRTSEAVNAADRAWFEPPHDVGISFVCRSRQLSQPSRMHFAHGVAQVKGRHVDPLTSC